MPLAAVWKGKTEEDVLRCLEEAYTNEKSAQVFNWHKIDRAHEESVDIECRNPNGKIVLQAKIKPSKEDIEQLRRLSIVKANARLYVYIHKPSASFKVEMDKLKSSVQFIDINQLHTILIDNHSRTYLRFLLLNSNLVIDLTEGLRQIFLCKDVIPSAIQMQNLENWWLLKDRTVKVHASLEYLENVWSKAIYRIDTHNNTLYTEMLDDVLESLDIISSNSSRDMSSLFSEIKKTCPSVLSQYILVVFV
jgi:hypothetical protein